MSGKPKRVYANRRNVNIGGGVKKSGLGGGIGVPTMLRRFISRRAPDGIKSGGDSGSWILAQPMQTPRINGTAAVLNNKLYVLGGLDGIDGPIAEYQTFDGNSWTSSETVSSSPVFFSCCVVYHNEIYAFTMTGEVKIFDGSSFIDGIQLPQEFANIPGLSAVVYKDEIYFIGDSNGSVFIFDGSTWRTGTSMIKPTMGASSVVYNGKIYVMGGIDIASQSQDGASQSFIGTTDVQVFDGDSWSLGPPLNNERVLSSAVVYNNKIYVIGGSSTLGSLGYKTVEVFNGTSWVSGPSLNISRYFYTYYPACTVFNNKIYVMGGYVYIGGPPLVQGSHIPTSSVETLS